MAHKKGHGRGKMGVHHSRGHSAAAHPSAKHSMPHAAHGEHPHDGSHYDGDECVNEPGHTPQSAQSSPPSHAPDYTMYQPQPQTIPIGHILASMGAQPGPKKGRG